jgi:hypothetical protein
MALGLLDFVEPIIVHSEFFGRLDQAEVSLRSAYRTAEGFGPVIYAHLPACPLWILAPLPNVSSPSRVSILTTVIYRHGQAVFSFDQLICQRLARTRPPP